MRGGVSETACPCYSSSPVPVPGPGPGPGPGPPKCTLLLLESWPGAEPSDKPELLVFSKTGMPQSQQFNRFHTLNSSVSLALSRASLIVPASLETSQLGQQPTFRPPFKVASYFFMVRPFREHVLLRRPPGSTAWRPRGGFSTPRTPCLRSGSCRKRR